MTAHSYSVGQLYHSGRTSWPETAQYQYRQGEHELLVFLASPRSAEISSVRRGAASFALAVHGPVISLCCRFAPALPWSDAPFAWHLVPESERSIPPPVEGETRALLHVILVDAETGRIEAIRTVTFSPQFTGRLHAAIGAQAVQPWDPAAYDRELARLYSAYTSEQLAGTGIVTCRGGS